MSKKVNKFFDSLTTRRYKLWKRKGLAIIGVIFIGVSVLPVVYSNSGYSKFFVSGFFFFLGLFALLISVFGNDKAVGKFFGNI